MLRQQEKSELGSRALREPKNRHNQNKQTYIMREKENMNIRKRGRNSICSSDSKHYKAMKFKKSMQKPHIALLLLITIHNENKSDIETYDVFLPESVLGIAQQKFFGHEGAVQPDCSTGTKDNIASSSLSYSWFGPAVTVQVKEADV